MNTRGNKNPTRGVKKPKSKPTNKKVKASNTKPIATKKATATSKKALRASASAKTPKKSTQPKAKETPKPTANSGIRLVSPKMFSPGAVEQALLKYDKDAMSTIYAGATKHSETHNKRRLKFEAEYTVSLVEHQANLLSEELVAKVASGNGKKVPQLFLTCSGEVSLATRKLVGWLHGLFLDLT